MKTYYNSEEPEKEISICQCKECICAQGTGEKFQRKILGVVETCEKYKCKKLGIEVPGWFYCAYSDDC